MTAVLATASIAVILTAVATESIWLWVTGADRPASELRTAVAMGAGALLTAALFRRVDAATWPVLGSVAPDALTDLWRRVPVLAAIAAFVAWDAAGFVYHWVGHRTRVGWASHQVHHSGTTYDLSLALRQSWLPLPALAIFPAVALLGFDLPLVLACAAVSNTWQALLHTTVRITPPRWVTAVVMTPETHRRHHAADLPPANLGPVFTVWDRLAGTWDPSPVQRTAPIGHGRAVGAIRIETAGWRPILKSLRVREHRVPEPIRPLSGRSRSRHPAHHVRELIRSLSGRSRSRHPAHHVREPIRSLSERIGTSSTAPGVLVPISAPHERIGTSSTTAGVLERIGARHERIGTSSGR